MRTVAGSAARSPGSAALMACTIKRLLSIVQISLLCHQHLPALTTRYMMGIKDFCGKAPKWRFLRRS